MFDSFRGAFGALCLFILAVVTPAPPASAQVNLTGVRGPVSIGRTNTPGSYGHVNVNDFGNDLGAAFSAVGIALQAAGVQGGVIEVLPGTYTMSTSFNTYQQPIEIRLSPATTINVTGSGTVGAFHFQQSTGSVISGGTINVLNATGGQAAIKFEDGFRNVIRGTTVIHSSAGSDLNPMFGVLIEDETEGYFENIRILPNLGVIGARDLRGLRNSWETLEVSNGAAQNTLAFVPVGRGCRYAFEAYDVLFCQLNSFRAWGLGTIGVGEMRSVVHLYGSGSIGSVEDGHTIVSMPHIELVAAQNYILGEGVQGWVTINDVELGLSNFAIGGLGDAAIKITRSTEQVAELGALTATNSNGRFTLGAGNTAFSTVPPVGTPVLSSGWTNGANNGTFYVIAAENPGGVYANSTWIQLGTFSSGVTATPATLTDETGGGDEQLNIVRGSGRVKISGGRIHNVARSQATAEGLYGLVLGGVTAATQINVTGTNTFARASGTWITPPVAGQWVRSFSFTAGANNGNYKVVSSTSNTVTVAGTLTNETGTGDEVLFGAYPYEGSSIWAEWTSELNIIGVDVTDQRSQWGISIDPLTCRGVVVDGGVTMHRGTGNGPVAPFRLGSVTLPNAGSGSNNYDNVEGIGFGSVWIKSWGATPVLFANGTVSAALAPAAATITTTNAPFFGGLLGTNATNYDPAGVGVATNALTTIRRLN